MKNFKSSIVGAVLVAAILSGCTEGPNQKQNAGTIVGAGLGAIAGSQFGRGSGRIVGAVAGTMVGGYIGNRVGQSLDKADAMYNERTLRNSLEYNPTGVASTWRNPDSGNSGYITPKATYVERGRNCREFIQEVVIAGRKQQAFGKACRRDDGSWEIVSQS